MNCLVTGGAGFIGSNLAHFLLKKAEKEFGTKINKLVVLDKLTYAGNLINIEELNGDNRFEFIEGDICDFDLVADIFAKFNLNGVFHLAAESHVDRSIEDPGSFIKTNINGTFNLLGAAKNFIKTNPHADFKFLHVSTDEVFGTLKKDDPAFSETTPYAPNSPYAASKASSDLLVRSYFHTFGLPVVTTNCSNNYGPYQFPEKLIPLMIKKILTGQKIPVYGDGSNIRDWLFVEDHCRGILTVMLNGKLGEVYCIGGNNEMQNLEVVKNVIKLCKEKVKELSQKSEEDMFEFVQDRPGHDHRYAINSSKIQKELGWQPLETFESGIAKTIDWYLQNEDWVQKVETKSQYSGERLGTITK